MGKTGSLRPGNVEGGALYLPGRDGGQNLATAAEGQGAGARQETKSPETQAAEELQNLEAGQQDQRLKGQDRGKVVSLRRSPPGAGAPWRGYHPKSTPRYS